MWSRAISTGTLIYSLKSDFMSLRGTISLQAYIQKNIHGFAG
jgi:hypothetical protein